MTTKFILLPLLLIALLYFAPGLKAQSETGFAFSLAPELSHFGKMTKRRQRKSFDPFTYREVPTGRDLKFRPGIRVRASRYFPIGKKVHGQVGLQYAWRAFSETVHYNNPNNDIQSSICTNRKEHNISTHASIMVQNQEIESSIYFRYELQLGYNIAGKVEIIEDTVENIYRAGGMVTEERSVTSHPELEGVTFGSTMSLGGGWSEKKYRGRVGFYIHSGVGFSPEYRVGRLQTGIEFEIDLIGS